MKFFSTTLLLAFGAAPSAAFMSQAPVFSHGTSLASTRPGDVTSSYEQALSGYTNAPKQTTRQGDSYTQSLSNAASAGQTKKSFATPPVTVQGGSLKTWALRSTAIECVQVVLKTEGRPLDADIDLWHGPDNTPNKMRVYVEDGSKRPFNAVLATPRGPNTVAVRNIGQLEFPLDAFVVPNPQDNAWSAVEKGLGGPKTIQGGALKTFPFESNVDSVQILLKTDGRPLNARIELLQGPNNIKQVMEMYIEDGMDRPFYAIIETPGSGNVVRIVNSSPVEFPMTASISPFSMGQGGFSESDIVLGGDGGSDFGPARDLQW